MAKKAHALARTLTISVLPDIDNQTDTQITTTTTAILTHLNNEENNGTDLDSIEVKKDKNGDFVSEAAVRTVADFYQGNILYGLSFNGDYLVSEGIQKFSYSNDNQVRSSTVKIM